jgi:DNA invertase Pin-like site-specific DNA recombinase
MKIFGYARVSTPQQNLSRQIEELSKYVPNPDDNIHIDRASGSNMNRPGYQYLKRRMEDFQDRGGSVLYLHELDRLARTKTDILNELRWFREHNVTVKIVNIPSTMQDLSNYDDALQKSIVDMINNVIIETLAIFAETERAFIKKRQREGIDAAKQKGKHLGRPKMQIPPTWNKDIQDWKDGKISAVSLYRDKYGMSRSCFYRLAQKGKED